MKQKLQHAAEVEELTADAVRIINEAVIEKLEDVEETFLDIMENLWDCTIPEEVFAELYFEALKAILYAFNSANKDDGEDIQKRETVCDRLSSWLKESELDDKSKDTLLTLVGIDNMNIGILVDILEMFDTQTN